MTHTLDHIVIAAQTLAQGVTYVEDKLGVRLPFGGEHPRMGTHNHLMRLDDNSFLEIIAINPDAPAPARPRWFGLDSPYLQAALQERPRVLGYLLTTKDIDNALIKYPIGKKVLQQRGDLRWHITIPEDGSLPASGLLPMLIAWHTKIHPAKNMEDLGIQLKALHLHTPYLEWLRAKLDVLDIQGNWLKIHESKDIRLELELVTPHGVVFLT